jgi:membrane glycosyltransferase
MPIISLLLLILLGVLGIAPWLKAQRPAASVQLSKLEQFEGWIGLFGLVWGLVMFLQWLQVLSYIRYAVGPVLLGLVEILVIIALSLILAIAILRSLFGTNTFTTKLSEFAGRITPYRIGLGFACLVLALYVLVTLASVRTF